MRNDKLGRKRKKLEDKSTTLMLRIDNKTIFGLLDKFSIEYDREAEIFKKETMKALNLELEKLFKKIVE